MAKELDHLRIKLRKQEVMQTQMIQLEQHKAQGLLLESSSSNLPGSEDEDEANSTDQAGNSESYQTFLSLRKQLRKSIFKKEEVNCTHYGT